MIYLETFLLYVVGVLFMFVVLFGGAIVLYMFFGQFKLFFSTEEVTVQKEKEFLFSLIKNKIFKFIILAYFSIFSFFYISQVIDYFGENRAYPQAKAYKIVADLVSFHYEFFIAHRNLYYRPIGLKFIKPYQKVQNYLMQKAFKYIPKDDAERAIWKYEYFYSQYVRARIAPIDFAKLDYKDLRYIINIGGHTTIYKPKAKDMLIEVEHLLDMLINNTMKDKYYDEVNRYTTTILFGEWWEKFSFLHYTLGVRTVHEEMTKEYRKIKFQWTDDKEYLKRLKKISLWLDVTKDKFDTSKELKNEKKNHKLLYPDLMGLRVNFNMKLAYADLLSKPFSCKMDSLINYTAKRKEFKDYASGSFFKRLSWKESTYSEGIVRYGQNGTVVYILHNFCKVSEKEIKYKDSISKTWDIGKINIKKTKNLIRGLKYGR